MRFLRRIGRLFRSRRFDADLAEEMTFHREMARRDLEGSGVDPQDAKLDAARAFGSAALAQDQARDVWIARWIQELVQDLRFATRTIRRQPTATLTAIVTLSVGIAASTTVFGVAHAVLLRPLPYSSPDELVLLWNGRPGQETRPSYISVESWRRENATISEIAVFDPVSLTLNNEEGAEKISAGRVSANFFSVLGIRPQHGRMFTEQEAEARARVALIGDRFWHGRFGASRDALGSRIVLDGVVSEIIGILPPYSDVDVWEPHTLFPDWQERRVSHTAASWFTFGRLRPGMSIADAQQDMNRIKDPAGITVTPLRDFEINPRSRLAIWLLMGAVLCLLVIVGVNVVTLSLARGAGRERELAVRTALGATRWRLIRQIVVEHVTLSCIGGAIALYLSTAGLAASRVLAPQELPGVDAIGFSPAVLTWAFALPLAVGLLMGIAETMTLYRRQLTRLTVRQASQCRVQRGLVVAEIALTVTLMTAAGLLLRSWITAQQVDPGFSPDRVLSVQIAVPGSVTESQRAGFYRELLEQVQAVPGVDEAGIIGDLFSSGNMDLMVTTETATERVRLRLDEVSESLFTTIGTPLRRGRWFTSQDGPNSPRVAIVNETFARRIWPGAEAVGRQFKLGPRESDRPWFSVVGVVSDMRRQGPEVEPIPQVFEPLAQNPSGRETLLVKTAATDPYSFAPSIMAAARRVDRQALLYGVANVSERLESYLASRRFQTSLLLAFSVMALLTAAVGVYGLMHYSVAARTHELGIRMALGARRSEILGMIMADGARLTIIGVLIGTIGALFAARLGRTLLFGVGASDPVTLTGAIGLVAGIAIFAGFVPARKALKVDPLVALRCE